MALAIKLCALVDYLSGYFCINAIYVLHADFFAFVHHATAGSRRIPRSTFCGLSVYLIGFGAFSIIESNRYSQSIASVLGWLDTF
ncbi:hypothetical protein ASF66_21730 [Pseudomonas sp. Leaf129]|nr:hypothetical protein ASF66_21730 [Pseudomonas sp. Leaf129]